MITNTSVLNPENIKTDLSQTKMRVIMIMAFSPKYEYTTKDTFKTIHSWENDKGEFMGVWIEDHAHKFGFNLLKYYPSVNFEVWRPDYRAERVYEHTFENGLVHRSFPAVMVNVPKGLGMKKKEYSPLMENYLNEIIKVKKNSTILVVPATSSAFSLKLFKKYHKKIPILGSVWISNTTLFKQFPPTRNPIRQIHNLLYIKQHNKHMKRVRNLAVSHWNRMEDLQHYYGCKVYFSPLGLDLSNWEPDISKQEARKTLNLGSEKIFLFTGRLVEEYQLDKVLDVIAKFKDYKFLCVFASVGPKSYTSLLERKIKKYGLENHTKFTGWLEGKIYKSYYAACDVFCSTCVAQAGPLTSLIAMLMEKPVMTTDAGLAAELLNKYNCGLTFPPTDYIEWEKAFESVITSESVNIPIIDRNIVVNLYDMETRINAWMSIFNEVICDFEENN